MVLGEIGINYVLLIEYKLLCNPITEKMANRTGLEYIHGELPWYQSLSHRLFHDLQHYQGDKTMLKLGNVLKESFVQLFKLLLAYQIRSVLHLHDSRVGALRDVMKMDDWKGQMGDIKIAVVTVKDKVNQYNSERAISEKEQEHTERDISACLNVLNVEDPVLDKERILQNKGGLVEGCCDWLFENEKFLQWLQDDDKRIFWITGGAGKGKTMLLCDIIESPESVDIERIRANGRLFYVFCEASKAEKTAATLLSLIYTIVRQQKGLVGHIQSLWKDDTKVFEGKNTLIASEKILRAILNNPLMQDTMIFIDALDECGEDLEQLLSLIRGLGDSPKVKWVLSSRIHTPRVDLILKQASNCSSLCLEDVADLVSDGVKIYIKNQVKGLEEMIDEDLEEMTTDDIEKYLLLNADHTYLWVSLACKELRNPERPGTISEVLRSLPKGLTHLYDRMMGKILEESSYGERRREIMSINLLVRRPITVEEYLFLTLSPEESRNLSLKKKNALRSIVRSCGHFLIISASDTINFVHKSAKDYFQAIGSSGLPLPGTNQKVMQQCILLMDNHLKRDMWNLKHPGMEKSGRRPASDPLNYISYACCFWVEHLECINTEHTICHQNEGMIETFLKKHFLHWLEALSLLGNLSEGAMALWVLQEFTVRLASSI